MRKDVYRQSYIFIFRSFILSSKQYTNRKKKISHFLHNKRLYKKHNLRNIQEEHKGRTLEIEGTHLTGINLQGIRYPDS